VPAEGGGIAAPAPVAHCAVSSAWGCAGAPGSSCCFAIAVELSTAVNDTPRYRVALPPMTSASCAST